MDTTQCALPMACQRKPAAAEAASATAGRRRRQGQPQTARPPLTLLLGAAIALDGAKADSTEERQQRGTECEPLGNLQPPPHPALPCLVAVIKWSGERGWTFKQPPSPPPMLRRPSALQARESLWLISAQYQTPAIIQLHNQVAFMPALHRSSKCGMLTPRQC